MHGRRRQRRPVSADNAPLIVSALFGAQDFSWLDDLRRTHYPPERNRLPAHLTLFHHLPPSLAPELKQRLAEAVQALRPRAEACGVMKLGSGVAIRIASSGLSALRDDLAVAFTGLLTPQDKADWRPHVTIQNKVPSEQARALYDDLAARFAPRALAIEGIAVWRYRGGPWEPLSRHKFRG
jgi:hypothetical protein